MCESEHEEESEPSSKKVKLVDVKELRPEGYDGTCLRPLGMCDLGSCDVCWHNPTHPRFKKNDSE